MDQKQKKKDKKILNKLLLFFAFITTLILLIISILQTLKDKTQLDTLISLSLSTIFAISFIIIGIKEKRKWPILLGSITLILLNGWQMTQNLDIFSFSNNTLISFTNKSLTEVMKWSEKNNIEIETIYEYSDITKEYHVINQSIEPQTNLKDIKKLTVAVSEGPNPDKEIIIPNMDTWNSDRVLKFIKDNYLTNVEVEFIESPKVKDTVIEQVGSGNQKRSDLIKLTFSKGEEKEESIKLIDLTNKTKFEATFWLKQHDISYEIENDFSNKIKRNNTIKQSKKAGTVIKSDEKITLTISKGPKIKVPDLTKMTTTKITDWIIKNKLKVEFNEQYDDTIKNNKVIKANYNKGDEIEQKTLVIITLSKGKLTMPKVNDLDTLKSWLEKYQIPYQEEYQFDDNIENGKIIKTSHKQGDTIKNGETIIITISQGKKIKVPKLVGMKKQDIIKKLKEININYNFIYEYNNKIEKDIAIAQSMKENSEVAANTTITITLSNGQKKSNTTANKNTNVPSSSNNPAPSQEPSCVPKTYTVSSKIRDIFTSYDGYDAVKNALYSFFAENYSNVKINIIGIKDSGMSAGSYVDGLKPGSTITSCNNTPYTISIAQ